MIQGSVLGPKLFVIFIDDIDKFMEALIRKFADDTKGAMIVRNEVEAGRLQSDLDSFVQWAQDWCMQFNIEKCKVMHVGNHNIQFPYKMDGILLEKCEVEKDLGVHISRGLKPSTQCQKAAAKANQTLGQIARAFHYRNKEVFGRLIKMYVRPLLEYAVAVWSPWTDQDCEMLEKVQRRAVRMISNIRGETYEEKLKDVGLMLLKERRIRGDMIETFKVIKGVNRVVKDDWFKMVGEERRETRQNADIVEGVIQRREDVIKQERFHLEVRRNFFNVRVPRVWNMLPGHVKAAATVNLFKNRIDAFMETQKLGEL